MGKKVLITGASGMVGSILLQHCIASDQITEIVSLVRRRGQITSEKLKEIVVEDWIGLPVDQNTFANVDICFYCQGVYTGAVLPEEFRKVTVDYPLALGAKLKEASPSLSFCLLSGSGADRTEKSRVMFARDKGAAENGLAEMNFGAFNAFRPGYIYPVEKRKEPNTMYKISRFLYPVLRLVGKNASIKSTELAKAMFRIGMNGVNKDILENREILEVLDSPVTEY